MPITPTKHIWMNGELVPWEDAKIHVLSHSLHYGTGVFEGIRAYATDDGPAVFRLTDHIQRLYNSAKILNMPMPYSVPEIVEACKLVVRDSGLPECYVRPIAYYGYGEIGLSTAACAEPRGIDDRMRRQALEPHVDPRVHHVGDVSQRPGNGAAAVRARHGLLGSQAVYRPVEVGPGLAGQQDKLVGHRLAAPRHVN